MKSWEVASLIAAVPFFVVESFSVISVTTTRRLALKDKQLCRYVNTNHNNSLDCFEIQEEKRQTCDLPTFRSSTTRRNWLTQQMSVGAIAPLFMIQTASAAATTTASTFRTKAYDLKEYTNSIVASKDTNVSPKEAYDVLTETIGPIAKKMTSGNNNNNNNDDSNIIHWALDVGAGAGVSTQTLYDMGFQNLDAVDWSGSAWDANVVECPSTVKFWEMDDERFFATQRKISQQQRKYYQVIVYNFAINLDKAIRVAKEFLEPDNDNAILLVPANAQKDYWYKQTYYLINAKGDIIWKSNADVGAWSVQFQPDVTSDTCQGIWCPPYNGFVKQK